jgi:hypothetical protein
MPTNEIADKLLWLANELHGVATQLSLDEKDIGVRTHNPRYGKQQAEDVGLLLLMLSCERSKLMWAEKENLRLKNRIVTLCPCCDHRMVHTKENCECVEDCPNAAD